MLCTIIQNIFILLVYVIICLVKVKKVKSICCHDNIVAMVM